ncbi:TIGR02186 family protein [Desulfovibrio sp. UCD-KL4C]|uniref:TIGR02186 family protein n=1 Tax=Desulfovibrio sp. UCD-KL4C TaxID=2578120 RepID=UPI0025BDBF2C|nr:TIGR02186 family protein [Desulfovibrio sp. UCD-KL4C]
MKKYSIALSICFTMLLMSCGTVFADEDMSLSFKPDHVTIGTTYNGATVELSGTVPKGCAAVVRVMGELKDTKFKKKGKVLGFLWMNVATVELDHIPSLFLVATDSDIYGGGGKKWKDLNIGFDSVKGNSDTEIFHEFLKLVEHEEHYMIEDGVVKYHDAGNGLRGFTAELTLPSSLQRGDYTVEVLAVRDGKVVGKTVSSISAAFSGFPKILSSIAFGHEIIYGISAVIIAILAGLFMSMVFSDKGAAH